MSREVWLILKGGLVVVLLIVGAINAWEHDFTGAALGFLTATVVLHLIMHGLEED